YEDFGQTLGVWGFDAGAYLVLPLLGPSSTRDAVGLPVDLLASPDQLPESPSARNALTVLRVINTRAGLLDATGLLNDIALDKYSFVRDAYLQRRRSLVQDGRRDT
ncbi:MlaA family lipoprotein, partial [Salmonella enterica]|uniref:MlaA family lipoprotein n=1 Tax=Salmonella enterica TaxID=28901 RepID=UPI003FA78D3D